MPESVWWDGLTLRRWHLKNFKSVKDATVDLAPLTVLVGANSAGKSTLLQSIRIAAQASCSNNEFYPLNAEQIRLGDFEEIRHAGAESDEAIELGGCFYLGTPDHYTSSMYATGTGAVRRRARRNRDVADNTHLDWSVTLHGTPKTQASSTRIVGSVVAAYIDEDEQARFAASRAKKPSGVSSYRHEVQYEGTVSENGIARYQFIDANIFGGFPHGYLVAGSAAELLFSTWFEYRTDEVRGSLHRESRALAFHEAEAERTLKDSDLEVISLLIAKDLMTVFEQVPKEDWRSPSIDRMLYAHIREYYRHPDRVIIDLQRSQLPEIYGRVMNLLTVGDRRAAREIALPEILRDSLVEAREFLSTRVQHLGPLRMDPQVVYTSSPSNLPGFIGTKGEYCASVLENSGHLRITNPPRLPDGPRTPTTLLDAVNWWAVHLGIAGDFSTRDRGRLGLQLSVHQPNLEIELDLTSVGTGVSQILPVLVMCLQAPPGSLLLIEQPELHLNPGVQQRLADFLLAVAASGRQVIVETHSDYMVTRLRRRAAEDSHGLTRQRIGLVFAERTDNATEYTVVSPEADGSMTNWPRNFFDEAAEDSEALLELLLNSLREP